MNQIFIYLFITILSISSAKGRDPNWFNRRSNDLENAIKIENTNEKIDALGNFMSIASHGKMDEEQKIIFNRAQNELLSIPGHAKYYQDKIERMRAELLANSKMNPSDLVRMQDRGKDVVYEPSYLTNSEVALRTLKYMPSAETVSVLGHFLNDPVGRDGKSLLGTPLKTPGADYGPRLSHAEVATQIIRVLGIEHPPYRNIEGKITAEEVDAWKDWWNQVKDGKRTYHFIGSKIEYGPDGPATKEVIQRSERNQKRDAERETGHRKTSTAPETAPSATVAAKPLSIAGILAACALCAGAFWYYLKGRTVA